MPHLFNAFPQIAARTKSSMAMITISCFASAPTLAAEWHKIPAIGPNPSGVIVEVDLASRRPGKTLWMRITLSRPDRDSVRYSLIQLEVNCTKDQIRALNALMYDGKHRIIPGLGRTTPEAWRIVPPEPGLDQTMLSIACRRARFASEKSHINKFGNTEEIPIIP
ncbi:MAG: hypothetical protein KGL18_14140 [Burkholderiales bacterium]|nr:hypothetical protein [Burkholderiales bacterium]MDE1926727.1 hypothetical protein [Burkholderiales bacterium]MDE2504099.1 hypothetical protein [Burkholderiales bacterium]